MDSMTTSTMSFTASIAGVPIPEFVSLDPKYKCTKCHRALNVPQQLPCGHRICRSCVDDEFSTTDQITCPSGEEDCEGNITRDNVFPDFSAQREMRRFPVYCVFKVHGCSATMPWTQYKSHIEQCTYRLRRCEHCNEEISIELLQNHLDNECPMAPCRCPHGCELGPNGILRSQLNEHLDQCPRRPQTCPLQTVGCEFMGNHEELQLHQNDIWPHLLLLARPRSSSMSGAADYTRAEMSFRRELEMLKNLKARLEEQLNWRTQTAASEPSPVKQEDLVPLTTRIEELEQTRSAVLPLSDDARQMIRSRDDEITRLRQRVQELDLRCQFLESAGYEGMLLWKIGNFTQRLKDAREGRTTSLYSPPFYAGRYGYKLCARSYLNGDGIGKGNHISLFFVVMQGDYDDLLVWPFSAKVTLSLIDQSGSLKHYTESFRPDSRSSSFHKPTAPMNVASGCPAFIAHDQLLATGSDGQVYIKNDTIYFRISVEMSEIRSL